MGESLGEGVFSLKENPCTKEGAFLVKCARCCAARRSPFFDRRRSLESALSSTRLVDADAV